MEVVRIKKILARNLLISIGLHCVRRSSWTGTTLATLIEGQICISFGIQLYKPEVVVDDEIQLQPAFNSMTRCHRVVNKNTSFYLDPLQLSDIRQTRNGSKQDLFLFPAIQYFSSVQPGTESNNPSSLKKTDSFFDTALSICKTRSVM